MAKEYISREAAMPDGFCVGVSCQICPFCDDPIKGGCKVARFIDAIPDADVVEVVRCRECRHAAPMGLTSSVISTAVARKTDSEKKSAISNGIRRISSAQTVSARTEGRTNEPMDGAVPDRGCAGSR